MSPGPRVCEARSSLSKYRAGSRWGTCAMQLCLLLACLVTAGWSVAGTFSPPGLYDPETFVLQNGLRVVLKARHETRSVAFRLVVDLGFWDFPCDKQEVPHFIEHLLFAGTSRHTEAELDAMVVRHGGYWNATTDSESTIYELEIHSRHALLGLDLLYQILTDAQFEGEQVELSRAILHREGGGEPSVLHQWLYRQGIGKTGYDKYLAATGYACDGLPTANGITREELLQAKAKYYIPQRMTLIAVGDFDEGEMARAVSQRFGALSPSPAPPPVRARPPAGNPPGELRSTFTPFVGAESEVALVFQVPGYVDDATVPLTLLSEYLETRLFEQLRIANGLAYEPSAEYLPYESTGLFSVYAGVDPGSSDEALRILRRELARVAAGEFDQDTLQDARSYLLLAGAQGVESNAGFADYYASSVGELRRHGRFRDLEASLEELDAARLAEVARTYLDPDLAVVIRESPFLSHNQLYLTLGIAGLVGIAVPVQVAHSSIRRRRRRRAQQISAP